MDLGTRLVKEAAEGNREHVENILKSHPKLVNHVLQAGGSSPSTALGAAIEGHHVELAKLLIEKWRAHIGPIGDAVEPALFAAVRAKSVALIKYLVIERKANVNEMVRGRTPLQDAYNCGSYDENVMQCLIACGANVSAHGGTPIIHRAAEQLQLRLLQWLVKDCGAKCNLRDGNGRTPLHCALYAATQSPERSRAAAAVLTGVVKFLVEDGGCDWRDEDDQHMNAFFLASFLNHHEVLQYFLDAYVTNPAIFAIDGITPLHLAAQWSNEPTVRKMVEVYGMDASAVTSAGCSVLHFAAAGGAVSVVKYLVEECGVNIEKSDNVHETALHYALLDPNNPQEYPGSPRNFIHHHVPELPNKRLKVASYLHDKMCADIRAKNYNGVTALDYACRNFDFNKKKLEHYKSGELRNLTLVFKPKRIKEAGWGSGGWGASGSGCCSGGWGASGSARWGASGGGSCSESWSGKGSESWSGWGGSGSSRTSWGSRGKGSESSSTSWGSSSGESWSGKDSGSSDGGWGGSGGGSSGGGWGGKDSGSSDGGWGGSSSSGGGWGGWGGWGGKDSGSSGGGWGGSGSSGGGWGGKGSGSSDGGWGGKGSGSSDGGWGGKGSGSSDGGWGGSGSSGGGWGGKDSGSSGGGWGGSSSSGGGWGGSGSGSSGDGSGSSNKGWACSGEGGLKGELSAGWDGTTLSPGTFSISLQPPNDHSWKVVDGEETTSKAPLVSLVVALQSQGGQWKAVDAHCASGGVSPSSRRHETSNSNLNAQPEKLDLHSSGELAAEVPA